MPEHMKTMIDLARDLPVDALTIPRETRKTLQAKLVAVELVEQRLAEVRRDLNLALIAAAAAGGDVPPQVTTALAASLELLPQNLMGE